jgi:hypothetical protein
MFAREWFWSAARLSKEGVENDRPSAFTVMA